ncbi:hypothetical protein AAMO2058_001341500 [Amorphochlora amoebiformis]
MEDLGLEQILVYPRHGKEQGLLRRCDMDFAGLSKRGKNGETIDEDCEEDTLTTLGTKEEGGPRFSEEFKCLTRHVYLDQMLNQRYKPSCHMRKQ